MVTFGIFVAVNAIQRDTASSVLARSLVMLEKATSVVGTFTQKTPGQIGIAKGEFHLKKDANLAVFSKMNSEICDGIMRTSIDRVKGTYTVKDVRVFDLPYIPGFEGFTMNNGKSLVEKFKFEADQTRAPQQPQSVRMDRMDGRNVVSYSIGGSTVFLDPDSAMPIGSEFMGENGKRVSMRFDNVKTNVRISSDTFDFRGNERMMEQQVIERGMMRVGQRMPISNNQGMNLLAKEMAGKRSTVILFFDDKNAPCGEMLKKMFEISKRKPKDVAVVGVARTRNWRKMFTGSLNFTVIEDAELSRDSISAQFGIARYPTLYVIDHQSEATYVQIGSNDGELNPILRGLGFSIPQR
jgi:outer membrane lipoprotein-sorting protein